MGQNVLPFCSKCYEKAILVKSYCLLTKIPLKLNSGWTKLL